MMMIPRRKEFDLLEDMFRDPFFHAEESKIMKTDIKEHENNYSIVVDLPGYNKDDIKVAVDDGYLTIHATMSSKNEEKEKGKCRISHCQGSYPVERRQRRRDYPKDSFPCVDSRSLRGSAYNH